MLDYIFNTTNLYIGIIILIFYLIKKFYINGTECVIKTDLSEKVIIITGASEGIGKETARYLAYMRAHVVFACRNKAKTLRIID